MQWMRAPSLSVALPQERQLIPHQRVRAACAATFKKVGDQTKLDRLYQQGSAKMRFPRQYGGPLEAVLINTAGGLTGGDRLDWTIKLGVGTNAVVTTQACEKAYKSSGGVANVTTSIDLGEESSLHWLPQETILYDGSALARRMDVTLSRTASLLAVECIQLGRGAMGETINTLSFHERWRIVRDGKLLFADDLRLYGRENSTAKLGENRAFASLVLIAPGDYEQHHLLVSRLRRICSAPLSGFSAFEGKITGRILAPDSYFLRQALVSVLDAICGCELPRVWRI